MGSVFSALTISRVFAVLVTFCLVLEGSARLDDKIKYGAPLLGRYNAEILRSFDAEGVRFNVPNIRFEKWRNNHFGFRGEEIALKKNAGTRRVVCMGTSETYGLYEKEGGEWPAQLKALLRDKSCLEVVNVASVGLDIYDYKHYFQKHVLFLEPDIVILFANPFRYLAGRNNKIAVQRQTRQQRSPSEDSSIAPLDLRIIRKGRAAVERMIPHSFIQAYRAHKAFAEVSRKEQSFQRKPYDRVPCARIEAFKKDLEDFISYLKERKIEVILTTYPVLMTRWNLEELKDILIEERIVCPDLTLIGMLDGLERCNSAVAILAAKYNLKFIDTNALISHTKEYFADNVHYTDKGAQVLAENIANRLKADHGCHMD